MDMQEMKNTFEDQMVRIQQVTGTKTQIEIATLLGIKQSSVSDAKRRKIIPVKWLDTLRRLNNVNPDWILYGVGSQYLAPADVRQAYPHVVKITEVKPPEQCSMLELFRELVRRALKEDDLEALGKEVGSTWLPAQKNDNGS